jgi:hypothetical protein
MCSYCFVKLLDERHMRVGRGCKKADRAPFEGEYGALLRADPLFLALVF